MRYVILIAAIAGVLGLSACEKTTVTPVPVPQATPGPQGPAGEPGKSSTTVITPPPASSSSTTSSTTTTESKSTDSEKK